MNTPLIPLSENTVFIAVLVPSSNFETRYEVGTKTARTEQGRYKHVRKTVKDVRETVRTARILNGRNIFRRLIARFGDGVRSERGRYKDGRRTVRTERER